MTLVEFFDYRCPYCKQVVPAIDALLAEDKQLRFVYKEFPVLGPDSVLAARAALAARKQGKYDAMHRALMTMKGQINEAAMFKVAGSVGLDVERLKRDMADARDRAHAEGHPQTRRRRSTFAARRPSWSATRSSPARSASTPCAS